MKILLLNSLLSFHVAKFSSFDCEVEILKSIRDLENINYTLIKYYSNNLRESE